MVNCEPEAKQVTMEEQGGAEKADEADVLHRITTELTRVQASIGPRFRRAEARNRAGRFLHGLLAHVERKNGWQLAEELGEHGPRGVQRLLGEADWDEEAVRDDMQAYVVEQLGDENAILVVDETGFLKKGKKSAGVARQYSGTAGRRENSQVGVFLLYASSRGAAFLDRALYLPEEWMSDRVRCREAGISDEVGFATKGELARQMLARAFAADVPAGWVAGDTVYGYDEMRLWLDEQNKNYVLAGGAVHFLHIVHVEELAGKTSAVPSAFAPQFVPWEPLGVGARRGKPPEGTTKESARRCAASAQKLWLKRLGCGPQTTLCGRCANCPSPPASPGV